MGLKAELKWTIHLSISLFQNVLSTLTKVHRTFRLFSASLSEAYMISFIYEGVTHYCIHMYNKACPPYEGPVLW